MTFEELVAATRKEPDVTYEREVSVALPELWAEVNARGSIPLLEFMNDPRRHRERHTFSQGHVLGPGLEPTAVSD